MISIEEQLAAVAREIKLREAVYPRQVAAGKLKQATADTELARMRAVLETLKSLLWIPVNAFKPDADTTVLLHMPSDESEPVWPGYYDDTDGWHLADGMPVKHVKAWREMPE